MKQSIKALLLSLTLAGSSFSAFSASQTNEYMQYTFHYSFSEKVNLVLTHYLQLRQDMDHHLNTDINEQTTRFFKHYEQQTSSQLAYRPIEAKDSLSDNGGSQTTVR
ncbi:hypothetical protein [Lacimicrobium alkaliphilum]|uniref:Uncharacterized protein n=1 Tax=Lacimicrobium alkaliphilum TaxID=1526571 RepID=A0ABQ1RDF5_9ALTE|nr:hypothetical protein [Lacimicrobium alkaliphilum]GGD63474.1 hypothetical protein GCM10011357_18470 [Lacimicrobium alkaliphilum]